MCRTERKFFRYGGSHRAASIVTVFLECKVFVDNDTSRQKARPKPGFVFVLEAILSQSPTHYNKCRGVCEMNA